MDALTQYEALATSLEEAKASVSRLAQSAHAQIDGDLEALQALSSPQVRPPLIPGVPVDDVPAYVPPASAHANNALIPDTPLVDSPLSNSSLAFDDAPLWQS